MEAGCVVVADRGGAVDCTHRVAVCATTPDGAVAVSTPGAADLDVFLRSSAKPFQAAPSVAAGVLERLGLDDRHLAVACASHTGYDEPARLAGEILEAAGLDISALRCGHDGGNTGLRHNCSGNHALALARCVVEGWPTSGYLEPDHPVQEAMRAAVSDAAGATPGEAGDGCGMRAYLLPLHRFAGMFGRLAAAPADSPLGRCADAMRRHPQLVRTSGAIDTELMRAEPGLVAKIGAEGVIGVGLADGRGLALKVLDGSLEAMAVAAPGAARAAFGLALASPALDELAELRVVDNRGVLVGRRAVSVTLAPQ
jgi:L-asparaginase II